MARACERGRAPLWGRCASRGCDEHPIRGALDFAECREREGDGLDRSQGYMQEQGSARRLRERGGDTHQRSHRRTERSTSRHSAPCIFHDDPGLLAAFRAGEHAALAAIYRRYLDPVGAQLASLARAIGAFELAQPSAVADLSQEVFARAFSESARSSYDPARPYGPYLNAIAKNCLVDLVRKRRRDVACDLHDPASIDRGASSWDDDFERTLLAVVDTYVSGLSAPLRDVYEQRFALGLTQKATCDVLGITRRTLRTAEAHLKRGVFEALCVAGVLAPRKGGFEPSREPRG